MRPRKPIAFRWVLPIAELLLCATVLQPWRGFLMLQARSALHVEAPQLELPDVPARDVPPPSESVTVMMSLVQLPALLNLPSALIGLGRRELVPPGMLAEFWRAISWPVGGVVFWWIIGRGWDALAAARRQGLTPSITWIETVVAFLVAAFGWAFGIAMVFSPDAREGSIFPWKWLTAACLLWGALGTSTLSARFVQWRLRRNLGRVEPEHAQ